MVWAPHDPALHIPPTICDVIAAAPFCEVHAAHAAGSATGATAQLNADPSQMFGDDAAGARHIVPGGSAPSAGHAVLFPVQDSVASHTSAAGRQALDEG
jgi:hypothetical protein